MRKLSTLFLAIALLSPAYGCAHDSDNDGRATTARRTEPRASEEGRRAATAEARDVSPATSSSSNTSAGATAATSVGVDTDSNTSRIEGEITPTAQDQPIGTTDESITLEIRRAVVTDGSLGIRARNAMVVTRRGVVTLRGTVARDEEREAIERHARSVHGVWRVDNHIDIQPRARKAHGMLRRSWSHHTSTRQGP